MKMNSILKVFALAGILAAAAGCEEERIAALNPDGLPEVSDYMIQVAVDDETNTYTLSLDKYDGIYPVWRVYANARDPQTPSVRSTNQVVTGVIRNAGDYAVELQVGNRNGLSEGVRTATIHIARDLADPNKFKGFKYDSEFNLWRTANVSLQSTWFANNDWGEIAAPAIDLSNEMISFHTPAEMGGSQWQGQVHVGTNIAVSADETYDFSCYIYAVVDTKVTVKTQKDGDDNVMFDGMGDVKTVKAGGDVVYFSDLQGFDGTLKIAFDFGGNPDVDFEITNIVFKNHKNDDGTVLPDTGGDDSGSSFGGFDPSSAVNQWNSAAVGLQSTWFADNNWGEITAPSVDVSNDGIFLHAPADMGGSQWQGQVHVGTDIAVSADQFYDFSCHVYVSGGGKVTVKVQKDGDDDTMFGDMGNQKDVKAGDNVIWFSNEPGFDGTLKIAFDFGGLADQDIEITDIVFKNHADDDGSEVPVTWEDERNLWKGYDVGSIYYATGNDWAGLPDYEYERTDEGYWLYLPTETMNQWQAQMHIPTDIYTSSAEKYDFRITFQCSNTVAGVTVKLHPEGDDGTMYMEDRVQCDAGKSATFTWTGMPGIDADVPWVLTLDFGGNPADTEVTVSNIHFQVHQ